MARQASGSVRVTIDLLEQITGLGAAARTARVAHVVDYTSTLTSGTADGSIDRVWSASATYTTTPTDYDLLGSLTSVLDSGSTVSFVELNLIAVYNDGSSGNLVVGGDAAAVVGWVSDATDKVVVYPGGCLLWYAPQGGVTPTATTADVLQIAASAGSIAGRVILAGRSA